MTTLTTADLPTRAECWHDESTVFSGNALATVIDTAQFYNFYANQSASANGDSFTQSVFLRAGTYNFSVLGRTAHDCGKLDWYLDGVLIASGQDWYSLGLTQNVIKTVSVVVAFDGRHVLRGAVNGANAAAVNPFYLMQLTKMWFKQVAD